MRFSLLFLFIAIALLLPAAALGGDVSRLRERILVLDQARTRAEAEFALREERGRNGEEEKASFETIKKSLDRRIEAACGQLFARGGSPAGLPCDGVGAGRPDRRNLEKPAQRTGEQETAGSGTVSESEKTFRKTADRAGKKSAAAPSAAASRAAKTAPATGQGPGKIVQPLQPPAKPKTGLLEKIKLWWESLFKPKSPPSATGSTAESRQQAEQKQTAGATGQQNREQASAESRTTEQKAGKGQGTDASTARGGLKDRAEGSDGQGKHQAKSGVDGGTKQEKTGRGKKEEQGPVAGPGREEKAAGRAAVREKPNFGGSGTGKEQEKNSSEKHGSGSGAGSAQKQAPQQTRTAGSAAERGVATATGKGQKKAASAGRGSAATAAGKPGPQRAGGASLQGKNKVPAAATGPAAAGTDNGGSRGRKPEVGELDRALNEALGEFDGKLLSEQERLAARVPRQRESTGTGAYGAPGPGGVEGSSGTGRQGYGAPQGGPGGGYAGTGDSGSPGGGSVAAGGRSAPAGGRTTIDSDDDIVARQLREAAEKETDPELKKKLWQEYRKYKEGQ